GEALLHVGAQRAGLARRLVGSHLRAGGDRRCARGQLEALRAVAREDVAVELHARGGLRREIVVDLAGGRAARIERVDVEARPVVDLEALALVRMRALGEPAELRLVPADEVHAGVAAEGEPVRRPVVRAGRRDEALDGLLRLRLVDLARSVFS